MHGEAVVKEVTLIDPKITKTVVNRDSTVLRMPCHRNRYSILSRSKITGRGE